MADPEPGSATRAWQRANPARVFGGEGRHHRPEGVDSEASDPCPRCGDDRRCSEHWASLTDRLAEYVVAPEEYEITQDADWLLGAVLLVSRECAVEVGAWDESFFLYSEETDFCLRAAAAGWHTRYQPRADAVHTGGGSGRSGRTHAMQILNRVRLYTRAHGGIASSAYYAIAVLSELQWLLRGNAVSRASLQALLRPSRRPPELGLGPGLIPR